MTSASAYCLQPRPEITVETVIPPPSQAEPGPSSYSTPRDTLNREVIKRWEQGQSRYPDYSAEPVRRASSMQTPRQLLLTPQEQNSWTLMDKSPRSPTIVIRSGCFSFFEYHTFSSPPSEEHLATIDYSSSSQAVPKHRRSMAKAACLAFFVICSVVTLILLLFFFS